MRLPTTLLSLALLATASAYARWDDAEAGLPVMQTHVLGHLGVVNNSAVVEDARGHIYAANDNVLEYDGTQWSVIPVGRGSSVLSLTMDETGRLWCGADSDLGYIDEDATGARTFRSLREFLPEGLGAFHAYGVHRQHGRTLFVLANTVLIWDGDRFDVRPMSTESRLWSFEFDGATYVCQKDTGLWRWDGSSFARVDWAGIEHGIIRSAWRDSDGHPVFLAEVGLLRVLPDRVEPFAGAAINEINQASIASAVQLPDRSIAISTRTAGIYVLAEDGRLLRHLDRRDGLPNLMSSPIHLDRRARAWVGAYIHVASFDAKNVQTVFNADNGNGGDALAIVHSAETGTLSATFEGVGRLAPGDRQAASFRPVPFLGGAIRGLGALADGRVIAARGGQILRIMSDSAQPLLSRAGALYQFAQLDAARARIAIGESFTITLLDLERTEPWLGVLEGFPEGPSRLVSDLQGTLWASLRRSGVIEIDRGGEPNETRRHFRPGLELPTPFNDPAVFVLDGHAYAFTSGAIVALPGAGDATTRVLFNGVGLLAAERNANGSMWAVATMADRDPRLVRLAHDAARGLTLHATDQVIRGIGNITIFSRTEEHVLWIGGSEGTIRIDAREVGEEPAPQAPIVQAVSWHAGEQVTRLPLAGDPTVDFARTGTIEFQLRDSGDPFAPAQLIETRLAGSDRDWRLTGKSRRIDGLDEGTYTLEARVVGFLGHPGPVVNYTFTITPPWFRTPLAYLGYVVAFGGAVTLAAQWRTRRIRRQNAQLEQLVNRRTEELARAVSARSAFLANMGHEIRNPLNGVVGLVDTLRARALADEEKGIVARIGTCADQLISVIDDVLEYARIDAGRIALRNRAFAVREPVEGAIDILRAARPEAGIELHGGGEVLDSRVVGDPDRIRHILVNYLSNALKFGGGTPVRVGVRRDGPLLVLAVTDQGPGIAPDEQARLFVRFSRGSQAYRHDIPGTGLGLAACKAYAEAMGGDVSVESEPGRGATFFLRLPFRPAVDGADATVTATRPDLMVGKRALVVDDQDFNRFVLTDLLGRMGATTDQASSLEEARAVFRARAPDVVFVDFDLAGATGADLATWIRKEAPSGRDVPVIATTAFEVDEVRRRCDEAGMDGFLAKPVTAHRLAELVARIESIRAGGPAPAAPTAHEPPVPSSFLDILAGGDPDKRREIERSTWREVLIEALAAHRALRRDDGPLTARHAHRLVSAALILSEREIVAAARELNAVAKAGDLAGARLSASRLRERIRRGRSGKVT